MLWATVASNVNSRVWSRKTAGTFGVTSGPGKNPRNDTPMRVPLPLEPPPPPPPPPHPDNEMAATAATTIASAFFLFSSRDIFCVSSSRTTSRARFQQQNSGPNASRAASRDYSNTITEQATCHGSPDLHRRDPAGRRGAPCEFARGRKATFPPARHGMVYAMSALEYEGIWLVTLFPRNSHR